MILYAQWTINTYTVAYDGNGNTGGTAPVDPNSPYTYGSTVTVLGNTGGLVKTGFTFSGWNTAADGTGTNYNPAATFTMPAANMTLYARWKSSNADLSDLVLSAGAIVPAFTPANTSYTLNVPFSTASTM